MTEEVFTDTHLTIIEPTSSWAFIDLRELARYRDLLFFLIWRTIKVAYAQTIGGIAWAFIQPALQVIVFTIVFGMFLSVDTGDTPYALFSAVAIVPWGYMSGAMGGAVGALTANTKMLGKVYFPRIIYLIVPIAGGLFSFSISIVLILAALVYFDQTIQPELLYLPLVLILMVMTPLSLALWLSSLAIRFRDVQIVINYFMRMFIYLAPVLYPSEKIPDDLRAYYILNPFVGVIEGFNSCFLDSPMRWDSLIAGSIICTVLFLTGGVYFRRMERVIVDVI